MSSYIPKQGSLHVLVLHFFHWINLNVQGILCMTVFLVTIYLMSCTCLTFFWKDQIQKEVGSGDICWCPRGHLQKLRGDCACIVPWKKNHRNHLKTVCVQGHHLFRQPLPSSSKQCSYSRQRELNLEPKTSFSPSSPAVLQRHWWCGQIHWRGDAVNFPQFP